MKYILFYKSIGINFIFHVGFNMWRFNDGNRATRLRSSREYFCQQFEEQIEYWKNGSGNITDLLKQVPKPLIKLKLNNTYAAKVITESIFFYKLIREKNVDEDPIPERSMLEW